MCVQGVWGGEEERGWRDFLCGDCVFVGIGGRFGRADIGRFAILRRLGATGRGGARGEGVFGYDGIIGSARDGIDRREVFFRSVGASLDALLGRDGERSFKCRVELDFYIRELGESGARVDGGRGGDIYCEAGIRGCVVSVFVSGEVLSGVFAGEVGFLESCRALARNGEARVSFGVSGIGGGGGVCIDEFDDGVDRGASTCSASDCDDMYSDDFHVSPRGIHRDEREDRACGRGRRKEEVASDRRRRSWVSRGSDGRRSGDFYFCWERDRRVVCRRQRSDRIGGSVARDCEFFPDFRWGAGGGSGEFARDGRCASADGVDLFYLLGGGIAVIWVVSVWLGMGSGRGLGRIGDRVGDCSDFVGMAFVEKDRERKFGRGLVEENQKKEKLAKEKSFFVRGEESGEDKNQFGNRLCGGRFAGRRGRHHAVVAWRVDGASLGVAAFRVCGSGGDAGSIFARFRARVSGGNMGLGRDGGVGGVCGIAVGADRVAGDRIFARGEFGGRIFCV